MQATLMRHSMMMRTCIAGAAAVVDTDTAIDLADVATVGGVFMFRAASDSGACE